MKTFIKNSIIISIAGLIISLSSCSDYLELSPNDEYLEEDVFKDAGLMDAFLANIYNSVQHGAKEHNLDGLTDDCYFTHNYGQIAVNESNVSESDLQWFNDDNCSFKWTLRYKGIRYANLFIDRILDVPQLGGYDLDVMKGEAHFLRAYMYSEMVRGFGGVPIVTRVYELDEVEEMKQPRNTVKECLEYIIKDCDEAFKLLPEKVDAKNLGRATKWMATALKARMMLHLASPLFADRTVNTLNINQYDGDRNTLYRSAKEAAISVINSGVYELVDCNGSSVKETAENFRRITLDKDNSEKIFTRQFIVKGRYNDLVRQHGPNGYSNWSGTTPTHDLAQFFEYEDGTIPEPFNKVGQKVTENPYNGREPRFYATIGYDGAEWGRPRPNQSVGLDPTPLGQLQCGYYELSDVESEVELQIPPDNTELKFKGVNGVDTRQGPVEDWNGSWTGYYEKKLVDTSVDGQNYGQDVPWTYIRLAEMYLIAAEACIELGELEEAATYLDALRNRIGMPDTKATLTLRSKSFNQEEMREFLRRERRAELAYEQSRYFDVRRWMIAPETNNKELTGILAYGRLKPGATQSRPYIHNEEKYNYTYIVKSLSFRENRKWDNKMYFAPIKREEIKRNDNLVQNPGME